jgi:4-aminobutyrate aminotransferase-like enzyme/Ser/Thr protein kinase RdoA (MazF antagonist)
MALVRFAPRFSAVEAEGFARRFYGLTGHASPLPSERDQNFLLTTEKGERFVLKIANAKEEVALLEAQNLVMLYLAQRVPLCQEILPGLDGELIHELPAGEDGARFRVRLVTWLDGIPLGEVRWRSRGLLEEIGRNLGLMDEALREFDHPALHRDFYWDLAGGPEIIARHGELIRDPEIRSLAENTGKNLAERKVSLLDGVRRSVIYNDANDFNIIVGGHGNPDRKYQSHRGFIDLGDMVYGYTVGDLAILVAYAMLGSSDPIRTAGDIVRGYHGAFPLSGDEIRALFPLAKLRLAMSAAIAALQTQAREDNDYLSVSQGPLAGTLPLLAGIPEGFAEGMFRAACGLDPVPRSWGPVEWIKEKGPAFSPVVDIGEEHDPPPLVLDLGVDSPLAGCGPPWDGEPVLTRSISELMRERGVKAAVGRYLEPRLLYISPLFTEGEGVPPEPRTTHLGMDIFVAGGSSVMAPLEGRICALADNKREQDYGPVIILEHDIPGVGMFYTLYGHLSRESLEDKTPGQGIAAGERFAAIGSAAENGGWTPHLHFQVIVDLLGLGTDFPGVVRASEKDIWSRFSPDPNLLLGLPPELFQPFPTRKEDTLAERRARIGPSLRLSYKEPLKIVRGWKQYLFDQDGRRYIDAYNNVPHVGHCHPRVVEAATRQLGLINTNTRYLHDNITRYSRRLLEFFPEGLSVCYFLNSGSEANELALRLARSATDRRDLIVLEAAYHGHTTTMVDISPYKHDGPGGSGAPPWVHSIPLPDTYRGPHRSENPRAGEKYAGYARRVIEDLEKSGRGLCAFMAETAPSVGGQILLPPGYLKAVYGHVRRAGGLCIADEVQTGYGRIGSHFWAFEEQGVVPDIVVLGKPIGNGYPLGAVVTTRGIADAFDSGMEFFSTFGGSTVSCAVGLEVLDVVIEEGLQSHALRVGTRLLAGLEELKAEYPIVGDVRGRGLFIGVELVRDRETREPATAEAAFVVERMKERRVLIGTDGPFDNVLKIRPPMPFNQSDADMLLSCMRAALGECFSRD